jgi:small nuclear ribonucleoprotein (snRNP)-like protein
MDLLLPVPLLQEYVDSKVIVAINLSKVFVGILISLNDKIVIGLYLIKIKK